MNARVIYARSHGIGGLLIRWHDNVAPGRWSHAAIVLGSNVIEATVMHGVRSRPLIDFREAYPATEVVEFRAPRPEAGYEWALRQLGKPYDFTAIFGRMFRRSWQEDDAWHCSELAEAYLTACGLNRFRDAPAHITPNLSYMVI